MNAGSAADLFSFTYQQNETHGAEIINGFKVDGGDKIQLINYQSNEALNDLNNAKIANGSTTITLSGQDADHLHGRHGSQDE